MFRKSIITASITAAAFVAIGAASPAPASASGLDCFFEPVHCIVDEITPDRDRGPVEPTPGIELDVPGVVTDVGPGVLLTPQLPDSILDAITDTPRIDLPPVEIPLPGDTPDTSVPADTPDAPALDETPAEREPGVPPEAPEASVPTVTPDHEEHDVPAQAQQDAEQSAPKAAPTPTQKAQPVAPVVTTTQANSVDDGSLGTGIDAIDVTSTPKDAEASESLVDATADLEPGSGLDPLMAALVGMLGALGLMAIITLAFRTGRRTS